MVRATHAETLIRFAKNFRVAEWHQGTFVTELRTGRVREQLELF
jgi:hypothetical protein